MEAMYNLPFLVWKATHQGSGILFYFLAHSIDDDSLYFYHIFKSPKIDLITCT